MALSQAFGNSQTLSTTEWSCPRDLAYSSASPQTTAGIYQVFFDLSAMVITDEVTIRIYDKILSGGTQRILWQVTLTGVQPEGAFVTPALHLMHGWDVTIVAGAGTPAVDWSIRMVA